MPVTTIAEIRGRQVLDLAWQSDCLKPKFLLGGGSERPAPLCQAEALHGREHESRGTARWRRGSQYKGKRPC